MWQGIAGAGGGVAAALRELSVVRDSECANRSYGEYLTIRLGSERAGGEHPKLENVVDARRPKWRSIDNRMACARLPHMDYLSRHCGSDCTCSFSSHEGETQMGRYKKFSS